MTSTARIIGLIAALGFTCACICFGGGSIGWAEARAQIVRDDPKFIAAIEGAFEIAPSGGATRVGHDATGNSTIEGVEIGTRVPPFDFAAKPKGSTGEFTLMLIFDHLESKQWQVTVRRRVDSQ